MRATILPLVACLAGSLLVGCGSKTTRDEAAAPAAARSPSAQSTPVVLTPVDRAGFDAAMEKHRGKVVLVDYWATWCLPCVEQLPHTLEIGRKLGQRGLSVVTVSCDDPDEADRIAEFLRSKNAGGATTLISQYGGSPQTMEAFGITSGAVPFYQLYDRTGKLRQTFGIDPAAKEQYTPADIEAAIEKLLAE
jgi:thiol-disulfide isomerase/thioredoxin